MTADRPLQASLPAKGGDALASGSVLIVDELSVWTAHRVNECGTDRVPCSRTDWNEALLVAFASNTKDHGLRVEPREVKVKCFLYAEADESDATNQCVLFVVSGVAKEALESFKTLGQGMRDRATRCWSLVLTQLRLDVRPSRESSEAG